MTNGDSSKKPFMSHFLYLFRVIFEPYSSCFIIIFESLSDHLSVLFTFIYDSFSSRLSAIATAYEPFMSNLSLRLGVLLLSSFIN